ncbi:hypothetical protein TRIUR3_06943 [Triticum urartu]|uniref:Uncharacterized protein n=1 Tax=Triticum urartu TaxID=4572 RepID=M7YNK0_TRIUA|nr:hypothetical protein TRIUR3_06943 [Triticum urartu]
MAMCTSVKSHRAETHGAARRVAKGGIYRGRRHLSISHVEGARFCEVYLWEDDLDRYTNQRYQAAIDLANYHKTRHERCEEKLDEVYEELEEANAEIRKLKRMNKALQMALAATAPVSCNHSDHVCMGG